MRISIFVIALLIVGPSMGCKSLSTPGASESEVKTTSNHSFAASCKVSPEGVISPVLDNVTVYYSGKNESFEVGGVDLRLIKNNSDVFAGKCLTGRLRDQLSYFELSADTSFDKTTKIWVDFKLPRTGSVGDSAPSGGPKSVRLVFGDSVYNGNCKEIAMTPPTTCGFGLNLTGMPETCELAGGGISNDHYADLCEKYQGKKTICKSGTSLCSIIVSDVISKSKYSGYKANGSSIQCPAITTVRACLTVADPFAEKCESEGGLAVPDCTWSGRECKSICTKRIR